MTCGSFFKMRVDPKEQQARPYRKFLTWLIALQGLIILLATVEIFWAFGDPERFLGELFTTELTAGDIQQVMLFPFSGDLHAGDSHHLNYFAPDRVNHFVDLGLCW